MRFAIAVLATALAAGTAQAQQVVDGSDASLPKPVLASALEILGAKYKTSGGFQLRKLKLGAQPTVVCGDLAMKAAQGGFEGFGRFAVDTKQRVAELVYPNETTVGGDGRQASLRSLNDVRNLCPTDS